jgi:hypothetical protein
MPQRDHLWRNIGKEAFAIREKCEPSLRNYFFDEIVDAGSHYK